MWIVILLFHRRFPPSYKISITIPEGAYTCGTVPATIEASINFFGFSVPATLDLETLCDPTDGFTYCFTIPLAICGFPQPPITIEIGTDVCNYTAWRHSPR